MIGINNQIIRDSSALSYIRLLRMNNAGWTG